MSTTAANTAAKAKLFADLGTIIAHRQRDIRRMTYLVSLPDPDFGLIQFNVAKALLSAVARYPGPELPAEGAPFPGATRAEVAQVMALLGGLKELDVAVAVVHSKLLAHVVLYACEQGLELSESILVPPAL